MTISVNTWRSIGAGLVGVVAGYGIATYRQKAAFDLEEIREGGNVDYRETFINAGIFRSKLRETPTLDTLFAKEPFLAKCIRILWKDSVKLEAISIPPPGGSDNFFLIRGDSITQLWVSPRKSR